MQFATLLRAVLVSALPRSLAGKTRRRQQASGCYGSNTHADEAVQVAQPGLLSTLRVPEHAPAAAQHLRSQSVSRAVHGWRLVFRPASAISGNSRHDQ